MTTLAKQLITALVVLTGCAGAAKAQSDADGLARQLAKPVASLISVPFQYNIDFGLGPNNNGVNQTLNIQPVIPIRINDSWNVISRTIVPVR